MSEKCDAIHKAIKSQLYCDPDKDCPRFDGCPLCLEYKVKKIRQKLAQVLSQQKMGDREEFGKEDFEPMNRASALSLAKTIHNNCVDKMVDKVRGK
jgi:hypothetical protein